MTKEQKETKKTNNPQTCVRFSQEEYSEVKDESEKLRKTIPTLLKDSYFGRLPTKVLISREELTEIRKDLNRIGNNINQVAKKLNSGLMQGWHPIIEEVKDEFVHLQRTLHFGYIDK
jgi:hypothetical protein